jgi:hypothetical protein
MRIPIARPTGPTSRTFHIGTQKNAKEPVELDDRWTSTTAMYVVTPTAIIHPQAAAFAPKTNNMTAIIKGVANHKELSTWTPRVASLKSYATYKTGSAKMSTEVQKRPEDIRLAFVDANNIKRIA